MDLSEYVFELVSTDEELALHRGRPRTPTASGCRAILVLRAVCEHPAPATIKRLEHEYSLADELRSEWTARPVALTEHQGRTALVLEDPGGEPLYGLLGAPMELGLFLRLAVGLASSLRELHAQGIIHKDIKPANLLVDTATGRTWLMGFGIASRLAARAPGARAARDDRRLAALHGPRADRTHEPVDRFAQRPVRGRHHALRDVDGESPVQRFRPDGMGAQPCRQAAGAARGAAEGSPRSRLGDHRQASGQDARGPLSDGGWTGTRSAPLPCRLGGAPPGRPIPARSGRQARLVPRTREALRALPRDRDAAHRLRPDGGRAGGRGWCSCQGTRASASRRW